MLKGTISSNKESTNVDAVIIKITVSNEMIFKSTSYATIRNWWQREAITATHDLTYSVGQSRDVVGYAAGGTTEDYSYDDLKIPLTWVYELRDKGRVHQSQNRRCSDC